MKKSIILVIFIIVLFSSQCSFSEKPNITAQSALLIDAQSGRILLEYNPHIKLPMASTTKIMTALIALDKGNLKDTVIVSKDAVGIEGSSIYLYEDESISLEDLLYGLMLRSGNDSAVAIANHIGGNLENFSFMMNNKAKEIGANNTHFVNPHGLSEEGHYTTAYDLGLITKNAMEINKFKEISKAKVWKANRDKNNIFYNKNQTLWEYEGGDGVKIGYTIAAGRCLVSSATRNGTQLIAVVLNDKNWFKDCYALMDYGFKEYKNYVILDKGKYFGEILVTNGHKEHVSAIAGDSFFYPLKEDEIEKVKIHIDIPDIVEAPIKEKDEIGKVSIFLDGKLIHEEKLIAKESINELNIWQKILNKIRN